LRGLKGVTVKEENPAGAFIDRVTTNRNIMAMLKASGMYVPARRLYHSWYAPRRLRFYSSFVKTNDLVFDVGANIGTRLATFLELGAQVVAFEPQSTCFTNLYRRYKSNQKVQVVHAGLDNREGTGTIYLCENDALSSMSEAWIKSVKSSGRFRTLQWGRNEDVRVTTLDGAIERYGMPTYCKIDVEGYELRVIQGLSKGIPCLSFEFNPELQGDAEEIIDHLMRIGAYDFNYCVGEPTRLELTDWAEQGRMVSLLGKIRSSHVDIFARCLREEQA
jgi:FkbM family methyltransferase